MPLTKAKLATPDVKAPKVASASAPPPKKGEWFQIVNPGGAVHTVSRALAKELLGKVGYRLATTAEVKQLADQKGHQESSAPIAARFTPLPSEEVELGEPDEK
jgi:hypothetical protein